MSLKMHKNIAAKIAEGPNNDSSAPKENNPIKKKRDNSKDYSHNNNDTIIQGLLPVKMTVLDIERENRLSKVISLYSKGLNQEEMALELHVDQSTVSRDLQFIKQESKKQVEKYLRDDILFEYLRYMAGSNEITRRLWEIVQNESVTTKEKTNALAQLTQSYNSRLQTLITGPESYMNMRKSLSEIDLQRRVDSDQFLKAQIEHKKLFPHGFIGFRK